LKNFMLKLTLLSLLLFIPIGCGPAADNSSASSGNAINNSIVKAYDPDKAEIMPLTDVIKNNKDSIIQAYVCLMDKFDSQIKYPAVFRFELYQKVQYSGQPKGKRLQLWPDFKLNDATDNNKFWQDTFRAYKFELDAQIQPQTSYVLQVTCTLPNGRRLSADIDL
jgi:hypothetical protein